ncbi:MAG: sugar ABC transporter substrate-binding protein [Clostridia bacterium]|nr:sugar ABC transporter substrate-binding protein [Clostridia bacterium]
MKKIISILLVLALAFSLAACGGAEQSEEAASGDDTANVSQSDDGLTFAVSLGWMENASGQRQKLSFEEAFKRNGVTDYSIVDANYDPKKQSEQIMAIIAQKPDALFLTPSDPVGIADAVKKAADSGIRVYCSDGFVPGASVVSTVAFDNYAGGMYTMKMLADALIEKYPGTEDIEIAMIDLPSNEGWDARGHGAKYILSQPQYSRIKVTKTWSWDSTGAVTPRNAIDSFLTADPEKKLRGIWCAWDGAVFEGLEATAEARPEIMYTGSDGGRQCFEKMAAYPDQFLMTVGESVYAMPEQLTGYAMDVINGERVPRIVMAPGYGITSDMIMDAYDIKDYEVDGITVWDLVCDYDLPGYVEKINSALEANGKTTRWVPTI